jgi:hypothetical protein
VLLRISYSFRKSLEWHTTESYPVLGEFHPTRTVIGAGHELRSLGAFRRSLLIFAGAAHGPPPSNTSADRCAPSASSQIVKPASVDRPVDRSVDNGDLFV